MAEVGFAIDLVIAGTLAAMVSVLAHFVLRPAAVGLYRKLRAAS